MSKLVSNTGCFVMKKYCPKCNTVKDANSFYRSSSSSDGFQSYCKQCKRSYGQNEFQKEIKHKWYQRNKDTDSYKESIRKAQANYRDRHRESRNEYDRAYAKTENGRVTNRRYITSEKGRVAHRSSNKRYNQSFIGRLVKKASSQRRRARLAEAEGSFTAKEFQNLCKEYKYKCLACGRSDLPLTADHVIPLSKGGSNEISNIQPLCQPCNSGKRDKTIDYRQHLLW